MEREESVDGEETPNSYGDYLFIEQLLMNEVDNNLDGNDIREGNAQDLVQRIFNSVPMNERYIWLDRMNQILRLRDEYYALRNRNRNPMFKVIWVGWDSRIPLPWVNYKKIMNKIQFKKIFNLLKSFVVSLLLVLRFVFFTIAFMYQMYPIVRGIVNVTNMLTFSNSFLGQVVSFIFENEPAMMATSSDMYRLRQIRQCDGSFDTSTSGSDIYIIRLVDNWINGKEWLTVATSEGRMSVGYVLGQWAYKKFAESMILDCEYSCDNLDFGNCRTNKDTLIFRFANVLGTFFPLITGETWLQKSLALLVWIVYLSGAYSIFCFVFWNASTRMSKIARRYTAFIIPIAKSIKEVL